MSKLTNEVHVQPKKSKTGIIVAVVIVVAVLLAVAGVVSYNLVVPESAQETTSLDNALKQQNDFAAYYSQDVDWENCEGVQNNFECAKIKAPLNWYSPTDTIAPDYEVYNNPYDSDAQATIELDVIRSTNTDSNDTGKVLFTNPGGPGSSGVEFLHSADQIFTPKLAKNFTFASWDPRGVQNSEPIKCFDSAQNELDEIYSGLVEDPTQNFDEYSEATEQTFNNCKRLTGSLLKFVDTKSTARDLELLRVLFGQEKLDYLGFSYGTKLGYTYATLFPNKTGAVVLDAVENPDSSISDTVLSQTAGFDVAFKAYLDDCINNSASKEVACPFAGQSIDEAIDWVVATIKELNENPIYFKDGRPFNASVFRAGVTQSLYDTSFWDVLSRGFNDFKNDGNPAILTALADMMNGYNPDDKKFDSNITEANMSINCVDDYEPFDFNASVDQIPELQEISKVFGFGSSFGDFTCAFVEKGRDTTDVDETAAGSAPILVIGTLRDPATPYHEAVEVAQLLKNGVLLTYDGDGHSAYHKTSDELTDAVDEFLINGKVPEGELKY
ncbi:alpha/beta hydrolase [Actinomycetota bacterium]|nr:alpha/beta hydrolase [Actinomycetota bacterium]